MRLYEPLLMGLFLLNGVAVMAQGPTYNFGRAPTEAEVRAWDTLVGQEGKEMPPGQGTASQGAPLFAQRCAMCHGPNGAGGAAPTLVADESTGEEALRRLSFATILFSYIRRAMPVHQEGSLSVDEAYALTAFLLHRNGIIQQEDVLDAQSLPAIEMPNRDRWSTPALADWKAPESDR